MTGAWCNFEHALIHTLKQNSTACPHESIRALHAPDAQVNSIPVTDPLIGGRG
ncbi:hypothetical protein EV380_0497 [Zhihengliuella halotolerans]|uniref:Uncharacterized protein n=1 Tax=Zhihengliuella halotolerans TaxID=370736 RepID=A0A4Q8ABM3_9MICC|nr:hypothetical protein EV380_0497 [Zhihengliuella halotolerans]